MSLIYTSSEAAHILLTGGLVAIPTETVYGLAGNALDEDVVVKIFKAKNRPAFDPLILHIPSIDKVELYALEFSAIARKLAEAFWPGPLTIILPKKSNVPDITTSGSPYAGFRVPAHPLTLELLNLLPFPLAAPSANPFGYISPTQASHVIDQLGNKIDAVLEGGNCNVGIESTVIRVQEGQIEILRAGAVTIDAIEAISGLKCVLIDSESHPTAPGMLKSHYAPAKPFLILSDNELPPLENTVCIRFSTYLKGFPESRQYILSSDANLEEAARNLFACMRTLDSRTDIHSIYAEYVPDTGLGIAINDKLRKAAFVYKSNP